MTLHSRMHDLTRSSIHSWIGEKAKPEWGGQTVFANDLILTATVQARTGIYLFLFKWKVLSIQRTAELEEKHFLLFCSAIVK